MSELKVYEVRLYFSDFHSNSDHLRIKVFMDLTRYDKVTLPIQTRPLIHPYSDAAKVSCTIQCMKLEEIIATKLKCLVQRQHAPDLFDYVYSIKLLRGTLDRGEVVSTFISKTIFAPNPHVAKEILLKSPFGFFRAYWSKSIVCAKQVLFGVEEAIALFCTDLADLFKIYPENPFREFVFSSADDRSRIMEAGRSMTCLDVTYDGYQRTIEPYSLQYKQRKDGQEREYLYVYDRTGGNKGPGVKAFVADKLTSVDATTEAFTPRFAIELSKADEVPDDPYFFDPSRPTRSPGRRGGTRGGSEYVYQCYRCGRQFPKSKRSSDLRPHNDKRGNHCSGRSGAGNEVVQLPFIPADNEKRPVSLRNPKNRQSGSKRCQTIVWVVLPE